MGVSIRDLEKRFDEKFLENPRQPTGWRFNMETGKGIEPPDVKAFYRKAIREMVDACIPPERDWSGTGFLNQNQFYNQAIKDMRQLSKEILK